MPIIRHTTQPATAGQFNKIISRKIVTSEWGAVSCEVWKQTIPAGGYIVAHYHEFEEVITILSGCVEVRLGDETTVVDEDTTLLIPPGTVHSLKNCGSEPVRLMAYLSTSEPVVSYPEPPLPVQWD